MQCVICQWICLNELYKLMERFFKFRNNFSNWLFFENNSGVDFMHWRRGRHLCWSARVPVCGGVLPKIGGLVLRSVQTMQLCSMKQGTVSPWSIAPRCLKVLQVFPTMSDCEIWEHTVSCSQEVVEGGYGSSGPRGKGASFGLSFIQYCTELQSYLISHYEKRSLPSLSFYVLRTYLK